MSPNSCYLVRGLQLRNEKRSLQELALKFVKGLRHVPYEAAPKQFQLFSLTHRRIRGDLISMFKITHGLLEFPMESSFTHPTRTGLRGLAYKFHQQRCCTRLRQYICSIRAVPFWIRRDLIFMFKFTHGLPEFFIEALFTHVYRIRPIRYSS